MTASRSTLALQVRLPTPGNEAIYFEDERGAWWPHTPGGTSPIDDLRADALWRRCVGPEVDRRAVVKTAGAILGDWLLDQRAVHHLLDKKRTWTKGQARLRIELQVPLEWVDWPWEIVASRDLGHMAVEPPWTVVRVSDRGEAPPTSTADSQLLVDLLGVRLDGGGDLAQLATDEEIEGIRNAIEAFGERRFKVSVDPLGAWSALVERCEERRPPHVFHFAGHGLDDGRGLVFRGTDGQPERVDDERLASLLTGGGQGRETRLVVLNACTTSAGPRRLQPFGGLAQRLIQKGIPAVVSFQNPVEDQQALALAASFYDALGRGDSVDCALQTARRDLFLAEGDHVAWAFLTLSVSGSPKPFFHRGRAGLEALESEGYGKWVPESSAKPGDTDPTPTVVSGEISETSLDQLLQAALPPRSQGFKPVCPTLLVGLGGTGKEILLRFRRLIVERFGSLEALPFIQFVHLDTDGTRAAKEQYDIKSEDDPLFAKIRFQPAEQVRLTIEGGTDKYVELLHQHPNIRRWYEARGKFANLGDLGQGAGQVRMASRLGFFHAPNFGTLSSLLDRAQGQLRDAANLQKASDLGFQLDPARIEITVAASLAGGTGGGVFLDAGYLLRNLFPDADRIGIFLMPNFFRGYAGAGRARANGYAALTELNYYSFGHAFQGDWDPANPVWIGPPPYSNTYLIDVTNDAGLEIGSSGKEFDIYGMVAEFLFQARDQDQPGAVQHERLYQQLPEY